jgi:hypothetical protein
MKILKRIFTPKVVRVTLNVLEEISLERNSVVFQMVRSQIDDAFLKHYDMVLVNRLACLLLATNERNA